MSYFTVIIPVYNREDVVNQAIDSVLNQTFIDYELIIVDDGSTDNTPAVLEKYQNKIKIIKHSRNLGVSAARNSAIKSAKGQYIAMLDSDDKWYPQKLEEHYKYINHNSKIRIHQSEETWIRNGKRVNPMRKHKKISGNIFEESLALCLVSPSAVVIDRKLFDEYGLFDEKMSVCEDYDLWLRISAREEIGLLDKELICKYGGHDDQLSRKEWGMDRFRVYAMLKLYYKKNYLSEQQHKLLCDMILYKVNILKNGALKRDNQALLSVLNKIIDLIDSRSSSYIGFDLLLQG